MRIVPTEEGLATYTTEITERKLLEEMEREITEPFMMAVNVSARQFRQPAFVNQVLQVIERTGADPRRIKLELTESLLLANIENTVDTMHALKEKGIGFALDVLTDPNDVAIARTTLGLGHTPGLEVIAKGVETADQRNFLALHGCRAFQAYLFGQPVTAEQF